MSPSEIAGSDIACGALDDMLQLETPQSICALRDAMLKVSELPHPAEAYLGFARTLLGTMLFASAEADCNGRVTVTRANGEYASISTGPCVLFLSINGGRPLEFHLNVKDCLLVASHLLAETGYVVVGGGAV